MTDSVFNLDQEEKGAKLEISGLLHTYFRSWPWSLITTIFFLVLAFIYLRYTSIIHMSEAKIKMIEETAETDIASQALSNLNGSSTINLNNEIEVLKSFRLLEKVVEALNLDVKYYNNGSIKSTEIWDPPFIVTKNLPSDSLIRPEYYEISINASSLTISAEDYDDVSLNFSSPNALEAGLPFTISMADGIDLTQYEGLEYTVALWPIKETVLNLSSSLNVNPTNKKSDILSLAIYGESFLKNEAVLNSIVEKFNNDGILDRQAVSKRTLDFIDDRFIFLSEELDSIERGKQDFKQENNLSYIEEDATFNLQRKSVNEAEALKLRTQLSLIKLLKQSVWSQATYSLLPSDVGLENNSVNVLVANYNELALRREKLLVSVGENHPTIQTTNGQLERGKQNILNTVEVYEKQLRSALAQRSSEQSLAGSLFSRLPEKEKILRSIERQQSIKENLFLLLLRKREEAAINFAVTAPSIKVVDYAITGTKPVSPKRPIVYGIALITGLLLPLGVLYLKSRIDSKIHDRADVEKLSPEIPVLAEIPNVPITTESTVNSHRQNLLYEPFQILGTNIIYHLAKPPKEQGSIILLTSAIKGEGKTFLAFNLSMAYASLNKRVLLVGADLRNPQLHDYFPSLKKESMGLSQYLQDLDLSVEDCIYKGSSKTDFLRVCPGGSIPDSAPKLLSSERFAKFISYAKMEFDYIIIDSAPTLLVTDTMLISKFADMTLFVTRAGFTEKQLIEYSKNLKSAQKLKNMGYALNAVDQSRFRGYNYGYGYGYQEQVPQVSAFSKFLAVLDYAWTKTKNLVDSFKN